MRQLVLALPVLLTGCWNTNPDELPEDLVAFDPEGVEVEGWSVEGIDVGLTCPDGSTAKFYFVYPNEPPAGPMPAAVLYHSGSFDYVLEPNAEDPLAGVHYLERDSRLGADWAIRRIFVTLGMYPDDDPFETHDGFLPAALVEQEVAIMLPANCWGDFWHNRSGVVENDFGADFFNRNGRAAAEWGYQILAQPSFAATQDITLPVEIDIDQVYAVGLGEGGRAVSELISVDSDDNGAPDYTPAGILVDSTFDDLRVYYDNPGLYQATIDGLNRIFPEGRDSTTAGGLAWAPGALPPSAIYVYSTTDTRIPNGAHDPALNRMGPDRTVELVEQRHVLLNAGDLQLTREVVADLLGTTVPGDTQ